MATFLEHFRCSYRTGGWTNFGQNLDKCPIFVQGLSKVCPKLQNVLLLSNIFQISGQMSKFYISFVQDLSNSFTFVQTFLASVVTWINQCPTSVQILSNS